MFKIRNKSGQSIFKMEIRNFACQGVTWEKTFNTSYLHDYGILVHVILYQVNGMLKILFRYLFADWLGGVRVQFRCNIGIEDS